jgi:hypothetical protein
MKRTGTAGRRIACDGEEMWAPSCGKQLPRERPREPAEARHTGHQPSRHVRRKGTDPLSRTEEQAARVSRLCAVRLLTFFTNRMHKLDLTRGGGTRLTLAGKYVRLSGLALFASK